MRRDIIKVAGFLPLLLGLACGSVKDGNINGSVTTCDESDCTMVISATFQNKRGGYVQEKLDEKDLSLSDIELTFNGEPVPVGDYRVTDIRFDDNEAEGAAVALLMDDSGSIYGNDSGGMRFVAAEELVSAFLGTPEEQERQMALLSFDGYDSEAGLYQTTIWQDFTSSSGEMSQAIDDLAEGGVGGGTPLYSSIEEVCLYMDSQIPSDDATRALVVMTDGEDYSDPTSAIATAQSLGITLYLVGLGTGVDSESLDVVARQTGGFYIPSDTGNISDVFTNLAGAFYGSVDIEVALEIEGGVESLHEGTHQLSGTLGYKNDLSLSLDGPMWLGIED